MTEFRLLGRNPVRFIWEEDAMEASWTFSPDDPELISKLESMVSFVRGRQGGETPRPPLPVRPVPAVPPVLPAESVANGWELMVPEGGEE